MVLVFVWYYFIFYQNEVEYLVDMLHKADPPVTVEVYDNKKQETVVL